MAHHKGMPRLLLHPRLILTAGQGHLAHTSLHHLHLIHIVLDTNPLLVLLCHRVNRPGVKVPGLV
jgi:hypothetical protein